MACIRKRRGVWVLHYRDATNTRRTPSFDTKAAAEDHADRVGAFAHRGRRTPTVDPQIRSRPTPRGGSRSCRPR